MELKEMLDRMTFILSGENLNRVEIKNGEKPQIILDLHGMNRKSARRVVKSIIAMYRFAFSFVIIHGYNHGTALKEMLSDSFDNPRIMSKKTPNYNPGLTCFEIAA